MHHSALIDRRKLLANGWKRKAGKHEQREKRIKGIVREEKEGEKGLKMERRGKSKTRQKGKERRTRKGSKEREGGRDNRNKE